MVRRDARGAGGDLRAGRRGEAPARRARPATRRIQRGLQRRGGRRADRDAPARARDPAVPRRRGRPARGRASRDPVEGELPHPGRARRRRVVHRAPADAARSENAHVDGRARGAKSADGSLPRAREPERQRGSPWRVGSISACAPMCVCGARGRSSRPLTSRVCTSPLRVQRSRPARDRALVLQRRGRDSTPPSSGIEPSQTASLPVVEEVNTLPKTPPGDAPDHSGTNARTALISTLSTHVGALTAAGDIAAAKVAAEALVHLLGLPPVADTSTRPP